MLLRRAGVLALGVLTAGACVRTRIGDPMAAPAGAGITIGERTVPLTVCQSGDRESFHGVDLADAASTVVVRVVVDPIEGTRARVIDRSHRHDVVLDARGCERLEADVHRTRWQVDDVRDLSGSLLAECGEQAPPIRIDVRFAHCH